MHSNYSDILELAERLELEPLWWDVHGCPRFARFAPRLCPSIYATRVVLLRIACQDCGRKFDVQMHEGFWPAAQLPPKNWHYGDPPRHDCPGAGETMNCEDLRVLQVWHREVGEEWTRVPELEGVIDGGGDTGGDEAA